MTQRNRRQVERSLLMNQQALSSHQPHHFPRGVLTLHACPWAFCDGGLLRCKAGEVIFKRQFHYLGSFTT